MIQVWPEIIKVGGLTATASISIILVHSLMNRSRTGPQIRAEVLQHYRPYLVYALSRQYFWGWLICFFWSLLGEMVWLNLATHLGIATNIPGLSLAAFIMLGLATGLAFLDQLLHRPGNLCASWQYRISRLYGIWQHLTPARLNALHILFCGGTSLMLYAGIFQQHTEGNTGASLISAALLLGIVLFKAEVRHRQSLPEPPPIPQQGPRPNIVMIGCDTLRVDRLGISGHHRPTSPYIDQLCQNSTFFNHCLVPLARTAPSLASLFTGLWPHQHGIRTNFTAEIPEQLQQQSFPTLLNQHGYTTAALSDWCGSDLKKFGFGFKDIEAPDDQWNLKYYLRQGPMQLRLFLSLFTNNFIGQRLLPEIYYQAGNPLETSLGTRACQKIARLAESGQPFLLNVFMAGTHAPFGSEYPHYLDFADPAYSGESKFVMTTFADPNDIILLQEKTQDSFDLEQIQKLYDGCIRKFDTEVQKIAEYLKTLQIADNTLIIIYSDHGMEFFENQSWGQGNTILGNDYGGKIPLIVHDPRNPKGQIVHQPVRSIDLAPTLLDLCGLNAQSQMAGISLKPHLTGPTPQTELTAYQETGIWLGHIKGLHPDHLRYPTLLDLLEIPDKKTGTLAIKPEYRHIINQAKDRMLRKGRWKLVHQPLNNRNLIQLFDMEADPACTNDLAFEHPKIVEELRQELTYWLKADGLQ